MQREVTPASLMAGTVEAKKLPRSELEMLRHEAVQGSKQPQSAQISRHPALILRLPAPCGKVCQVTGLSNTKRNFKWSTGQA